MPSARNIAWHPRPAKSLPRTPALLSETIMRIGGFQKFSLIDYPGRMAAVVFTQGCNFRCAYCHNPELVLSGPGQLPEGAVLQYLAHNITMLEGVCITGGEPTLQEDLPTFIKAIKSMGLAVKLDTNGTNPAMVGRLIQMNLLDYIAMDIKHAWEQYEQVTKIKNKAALENCRRTFDLIRNSGIEHEFRTTVFPGIHREEDFFAIAKLLARGEKYYLQQIRYGKNLEPKMQKNSPQFDVEGVSARLAAAFPALCIGAR